VKWRELGEALEFSSPQLDKINTDHPNSCEKKCQVILQKWVKQNPSATWDKLIDAVEIIHLVPYTEGI